MAFIATLPSASDIRQEGLHVLSISSFAGPQPTGARAMILAYSDHNPDRLASIPPLRPAKEISWHGKPPQITSGRSNPSPVNVVTSSHRGTFGQCFASTFRQNGSISTCQTHFIPARSKPRSKATDAREQATES